MLLRNCQPDPPQAGSNPELVCDPVSGPQVPQCLVSVIIPVYNSAFYLEKCLASCSDQSFKNFEVIVVDNASPDGSIEIASPFARRFRLRILRLESNRGFAGGVNAGLNVVQTEFALVLNADVELDQRFLEEALRGFDLNREVAAVGGIVFNLTDHRRCSSVQSCGSRLDFFFRLQSYSLHRIAKDPIVFGPSSPAFLIRMSAMRDVRYSNGDYLDSRLWSYSEDVDLWIRLRLRGWKSAVVPECKCWHRGGGTFGGGLRLWHKPWAIQRIAFRNNFLLIASCLPIGATLILLPGFLAADVAKCVLYSFLSPGIVAASALGKIDALMMASHVRWRRREILGRANVSSWSAVRNIFLGLS
jgi:GT2 family glycosyltransferase